MSIRCDVPVPEKKYKGFENEATFHTTTYGIQKKMFLHQVRFEIKKYIPRRSFLPVHAHADWWEIFVPEAEIGLVSE